MNRGVPMLARAHGRVEAETLGKLGASEVIQPEVEASATLIRHALAALGLPKERAIAYLERFRGAMLTGRADDVGRDRRSFPTSRRFLCPTARSSDSPCATRRSASDSGSPSSR